MRLTPQQSLQLTVKDNPPIISFSTMRRLLDRIRHTRSAVSSSQLIGKHGSLVRLPEMEKEAELHERLGDAHKQYGACASEDSENRF